MEISVAILGGCEENFLEVTHIGVMEQTSLGWKNSQQFKESTALLKNRVEV